MKPLSAIFLKSGAVLGLCLLVFACSQTTLQTAAPIGKMNIGRLQVTLPEHWKWLSPSRFSESAMGKECVCPPKHRTSEILLPRILAGPDTLVFDTIHSILWTGMCNDGCRFVYEEVKQDRLIDQLIIENEANRDALKQDHRVDLIFPAAATIPLGGINFFAVSGLYHGSGNSGLYFSGYSKQRPLNIYGRFIQKETMDELYAIWRSAKWLQE